MSDDKMKRQPNVCWMPPNQWPYVQVQVLMDIRDELQRLNGLLHCPNFTMMPHHLNLIRRAMTTTKKRRKK